MTHELISIPAELIENSILLIRGEKVILDRTLARLYGVSTKELNQAVKRNPTRFPPEFMFQLTMEETKTLEKRLRSQFVTLKKCQGQTIRYRPYVFTEPGILTLLSVLNSERAAQVNIEITRTFRRLRETPATNTEITRRLDALEHNCNVVFEAIRKPMRLATPRRKTVGFLADAVKR